MSKRDLAMNKPGKVLIIVENLPVPNDRRVWLEATTLVENGWQVSVISIKGKNATKTFEQLDGVNIYRYPAPPATSGTFSFVVEFAYCWVATFILSLVVSMRHGIDIIHACNPPETFWLIGRIYKLFGKRFIFDHHDLSPEMYLSRFGEKGIAYQLLLILERLSFATADVVITTNQTHRRIALTRGHFPKDKIFVVRSGPDHEAIYPSAPRPDLLGAHQYMIGYLGVLNPQDGVDTLLHVADHVINRFGRNDIRFVIMGVGDAMDDLVRLAEQLQIESHVVFTGWVELDTINRYLSTCDICVDTMPKNAYSDGSTLNKIIEYMAAARPIVAFDLAESKVSAQDAALFVRPDDIEAFASALLELLDDPERRARMGAYGRQRVVRELAWQHQRANLLAAYQFVAQR